MACQILRDKSTNEITEVLAPNGANSVLFESLLSTPQINSNKEIAVKEWAKTYTESFKEWAGEDLMMDVNGEPLLFFRGDRDTTFFKSNNVGNHSYKEGLYLTPDLDTAQAFADNHQNGRVYPVYVKSDPIIKETRTKSDPRILGMLQSDPTQDVYALGPINELVLKGEDAGLRVKSAFNSGVFLNTQDLEDAQLSLEEEKSLQEAEGFAKAFVADSTFKAQNVVGQMLKTWSDKLGVPYEIITPAEAINLTKNTVNPWTSKNTAFFYGGKVYAVDGMINASTVVHEFLHPFLRAAKASNPELYAGLVAEVLNTSYGKELYAESLSEYGSEDALEEVRVEEVLVKAIQDAMNRPVEYKNFLQRVLFLFRKAFRKLFKKSERVKVSSLKFDTTIKELGELMNSSQEFDIDVSLISETDYAAYHTYSEEILKEADAISGKEKAARDVVVNNIIKKNNEIYKKLNKLREDANNSESGSLKEFLNSEESGDLIENVLERLRNVTGVTHTNISQLIDSLDDVDNARRFYKNFLYATYDLKSVVQALENDIKKMSKKDVYENLTALNQRYKTLDVLGKDLETLENYLLNELELDGSNQIIENIGDVRAEIEKSKITKSNILIKGILPRVRGWLQPRIDLALKEHEKALKKLNERLENGSITASEYNKNLEILKTRLKDETFDDNKIKDLIRNKLGEAGSFNTLMLSKSQATDPIVSGLFKETDQILANAMLDFQKSYNELVNKNLPSGVNLSDHYDDITKDNTDFTEVSEKFIKTSERDYLNEKDEVITEKIKNLLNEFTAEFEEDNRALKKKALETSIAYMETKSDINKKLMNDAQKKLDEFENSYKHRALKSEVYDSQKIYEMLDESETDVEGNSKLLGQEAKREASTAFKNLSDKQLDISKNPDYSPTEASELTELENQANELYRRNAPDGSRKQGDELLKVEARLAVREANRKYYKFEEEVGAFSKAFNEQIDYLVSLGFQEATEEFDMKLNNWLENNTQTKYKDTYYSEIKVLISELKVLTKNSDPELLKYAQSLQKLYLDKSNVLYGYKNSFGEIQADLLEPGKIKKLNDFEKHIGIIKDKIAAYKKANGIKLSKASGARVGKIIEALDELTNKTPTQIYYNTLQKQIEDNFTIDQVRDIMGRSFKDFKNNSWIEGTGKSEDDVTSFADISWINFSKVLDAAPGQVKKLQETSEEFKNWWASAHYVKNSGKSSSYEKNAIYTKSVPKKDAHVETTVLLRDGKPYFAKPIARVPNIKYYSRSIKDEYKTGYDSKTGVVDTSQYKDVKGRWKPKTVAEGAKDSKYIDSDYADLKSSRPDDFKMLQDITEFYLNAQKGVDVSSRLGYEIPRFYKTAVERATDLKRAGFAGVKSKISEIKESALGAAGRGELTSDANAVERFKELYEEDVLHDMYSKEEDFKIPVAGTYNIAYENVSDDILTSVDKYVGSAMRHAALKENEAFVRSLEEVLKSFELGESHRKKLKGASRATQVSNFLEIEYYGQSKKGALATNIKAQKAIGAGAKMTAWASFAFNIPSALKNWGGAQMQVMLEGLAGTYSFKDITKGGLKATEIVKDLMLDVRKRGSKNLNSQMVEIFDADRGRMDSKYSDNKSRSKLGDLLNLEFATAARSWLEIEVTMKMFATILEATKVERTLEDGTVETIAYSEAFELDESGQIVLKSGIDSKYAPGGEFFHDTRRKVHDMNRKTQGVFAKMDQPEFSRYTLANFVQFFNKYLGGQLSRRLMAHGVTTKNKNSFFEFNEHYNDMTGERELGHWVRVLNLIGKLRNVKELKESFDAKTDGRALLFTGGELIIANLVMHLLIEGVFGYDDDDKERLAKLRKRVGSLPSPFTKEGAEFHPLGYLYGTALKFTMDIRDESQSVQPLSGKGIKNIYNTVTFNEGSILFKGSSGKVLSILQKTVQALAGDESAYYKKKTRSDLTFKEKGSWKGLKDLYSLFGIKGNVIDPVETIGNVEAAQNR